MEQPKKNKNWNEFWGEFLQVTFHNGHPDLWPARERKASWFLKNANLNQPSSVLDLGCGDGMIDVWLSRMGHQVTAVDRTARVLELAALSDDTKKVNFICQDLQQVSFAPNYFDAILLIETLGLMSIESDLALLKKCFQWLKPGSSLIFDCPSTVEISNSWNREFASGTVYGNSSFDEVTRLQKIYFTFKPHGEEMFGILDPYDETKNVGPGIFRHIYPQSDLLNLLQSIGFVVTEIPHYYEKNYYSFCAVKV